MSKVYEIIDAMETVLQQSEELVSIRKYYKMNGFTIPRYPTISIGAEEVDYSEETRACDRSESVIKVHVYLDDVDLERGEKTTWELAGKVRRVLLKNRLLGGLVDDLVVKKIKGVYTEVSNSNLHACAIDVVVIGYEERTFTEI